MTRSSIPRYRKRHTPHRADAPPSARRGRWSRARATTRDPKLRLLRSLPGLSRVPVRELAWLGAQFDEVRVPPGTVLAREGRHARELLLIVDGRAVLSVNGQPRDVLGPGQFIGELSILDDAPQEATVTAETSTSVLTAGRANVGAILSHPEILRHVVTTYANRLGRADRAAPVSSGSNVAALARPMTASRA